MKVFSIGGNDVMFKQWCNDKYSNGKQKIRTYLSTMISQIMPVDISVHNLPTEETMEHDMPKMDARFAETLVRKWHNIKSLALGPEHRLSQLSEILDGPMLKIWTDRETESSEKDLSWEYTLLGITIDSVTVSMDGQRATVEATIEEDARLKDSINPENEDSCSAKYSTRYEMVYSQKLGWKISDGVVLKS